MEMLQSILLTTLVAVWLALSVVFLITAIDNLITERKREQREIERERRDAEYHEARMKEYFK